MVVFGVHRLSDIGRRKRNIAASAVGRYQHDQFVVSVGFFGSVAAGLSLPLGFGDRNFMLDTALLCPACEHGVCRCERGCFRAIFRRSLLGGLGWWFGLVDLNPWFL